MSTPPRWTMNNVYPSLESPEFKAAVDEYRKRVADLERFFNARIAKTNASTPVKELAALTGEAIKGINAIQNLAGTISPFIASFVTTDSRDKAAARVLSEFEQAALPMSKLAVRFKIWLGGIGAQLDNIIKANEMAATHAFFLKESAEQSRYLMSDAEEGLAVEMTLSGGNAFGKLQGTITSQLTVEFETDGKVRRMPITALINLRSHPDESVRRRAYEAEMKAWESVKEPLAACLNGVKGEAVTLCRRRGRRDPLHAALDASRIDLSTLDALIGAMKDALPMFRRYFKSKAKKLGKQTAAWWDLSAPVGREGKVYTYAEARELILEHFGKFSPDMRAFAQRAFDNGWIDAEPREGKRAGAFCMGVAGVRESRVLCNFDGSFGNVSTIAHELGHAFHNDCAYAAGKSELRKATPMTLAETASIMCQTIVTEAILDGTTDPAEELAILEAQIQDAAMVVVDIYSRYLFETEVIERRAKAELSADEFCEIMERSQKAAYGDGLDERHLHKYMWTWKPHYYYTRLSFYNFPYAFGLLFGLGLYAIYRRRGAAFVPDYKALLASTGEATAADLAARFDIDIRSRKFWDESMSVIGRRIDQYAEMTG